MDVHISLFHASGQNKCCPLHVTKLTAWNYGSLQPWPKCHPLPEKTRHLWENLTRGCRPTIGLSSDADFAILITQGWWPPPLNPQGTMPLSFKFYELSHTAHWRLASFQVLSYGITPESHSVVNVSFMTHAAPLDRKVSLKRGTVSPEEA
jgi:hypothetical protein